MRKITVEESPDYPIEQQKPYDPTKYVEYGADPFDSRIESLMKGSRGYYFILIAFIGFILLLIFG